MSTLATLKTQVAQAACFNCLPVNYQQAIKAYLLAVAAGGSLDPKTLLAQSRAFFGVQEGLLPAYQAVFGNIMAGGTGDVSSTINSGACDVTCLTPQTSLTVQILSLAKKAGGSTDPKTLAKLAACFICIPPGKLIALQTFLMGVVSGVITPPGTLPTGNPTVGPPPTIPPSIKFFATKAFGFPPNFIPAIIGDSIAAWQGSFFVPTPTGFAFVEAADKSAVNASWDIPPATVDHTELWTSPDNITFALEKTVAAPGSTTIAITAPPGSSRFGKIRWCSTTGCAGFSEVLTATNVANPILTTWLASITTNGGAQPSNNTGTAINTFLTNLDTCGITSKILDLCMFVPDSLIAATTPLIAGITNPWSNHNFVGGDLGANGLTGNGTTKFLDPGLLPSAAGPQFLTTSACLFFYAYTANSTALGTEFGTSDGANDSFLLSNFNFGGIGTLSDLFGAAPRITVASPGNGFYLSSRTNVVNGNVVYFASSVSAWASIGSNNIGSGGLPTQGYLLFALNSSGVVSQWANSTLSCAGVAAGLTSAEGQCLFNAVQACRVALGGGFR